LYCNQVATVIYYGECSWLHLCWSKFAKIFFASFLHFAETLKFSNFLFYD